MHPTRPVLRYAPTVIFANGDRCTPYLETGGQLWLYTERQPLAASTWEPLTREELVARGVLLGVAMEQE